MRERTLAVSPSAATWTTAWYWMWLPRRFSLGPSLPNTLNRKPRTRSRPIGRQLLADAGRRFRVLAPTLVVVRDERREVTQVLELPDAVVPDERVLVDAFAPLAVLVQLAGHVQLAAACFRRAAVRRH